MEKSGDFQARMGRVEGLLAQVEGLPDEGAREAVRELVRALMDLHGAGLARILELSGRPAIEAFAADGLVASLLMLYDLHPLGLEVRVRSALDTARPFLRARRADVELVSLEQGALRLRLVGGGGGELARAVEEAVYAAAPDVASLHIEGADGPDEGGRFSLPLIYGGGEGVYPLTLRRSGSGEGFTPNSSGLGARR